MSADCCLFCGKPADRLCDAMIAKPIGDYCERPGKAKYAVTTMEVMPLATCDALICNEHRTVIGHMCGEEYHDTIDRCPKHLEHVRPPMMTPDKIPALRRKLHLQWRREQIKPVQPDDREVRRGGC